MVWTTPASAQSSNPPSASPNTTQAIPNTIPVPSIDTLTREITERDQVAKNAGLHINGGLDPNYTRTKEEVRRIAEKHRQAIIDFNALVAKSISGVQPMVPYVGVYVGYYPEPNDRDHRNYCGPGATQVALSARLPGSQIPSIDSIGTEENIDPNWGVSMPAVGATLNRHLNTSFYLVSGAANASQFITRVSSDFNAGYALVTALTTSGLPGWGTYNVNHIVTVYGMLMDGNTYPTNYVDTASAAAGYSGSYYVSVNSAYDFFNYHVCYNNAQAW